MAASGSTSRLRSTLAQRKQPPSRTRAAQKRVSYREESSESSDSDGYIDYNDRGAGPSKAPSQKPRSEHARKHRASDCPVQPLARTKKARVDQSPDFAEQKDHGCTTIQATGKVMPWTTLPYQILLAIFDYASSPLISDHLDPLPSVKWLIQVACMCRAFAEPALSVLYHSPPLTPSRAQALINHLATLGANSTFNYRAKIKYLCVEAFSILMHKHAGLGPIDLGSLIELTPQVRGIGIHTPADHPSFRKAILFGMKPKVSGKPAYQPSIFAALENAKVMLREWTWNQTLTKHDSSLGSLKDVHLQPAYQSLRKISFLNYQSGPLEKGRLREDILGEALNILPNLTTLHFKTSSIVNSRLLSILPGGLLKLEITDCTDLDSRGLSEFLLSKGGSLRQLILDHNHALSLSYLTTLGACCPRLEYLRMDLRYFGTFFTVRDSDPKYESLFPNAEPPTWPSSLQHLELFHLRRWTLAMAEVFFSSLTEAADSLPDLRELKIKASLDESGWRERIRFRDRWTERLHHVFQRKSAPPNPHLQSIQSFNAFKRQQSAVQRKRGHIKRSDAVENIPGPKGTVHMNPGLIDVKTHLNAFTKEESDSDAPLSKVRRSARVKQSTNDVCTLPKGSDAPKVQRRRRKRKGTEESSSEDSAIDDDGIDRTTLPQNEIDQSLYIHGMCNVVDVLIDNLRPTEEQLNEGDFLDDEISGDEDYNGEDDMIDDGGYAW